MFLGGIQKNSFIDFPGKISAVLFISGCNFRCPYCHNPELVKNQSGHPVINETWLVEFLKKRKRFLDGVVISGGEPTIHVDLFRLCGKIKQLDFPIKLDTNGSCPQIIHELIKRGLVDYIAMDIKTDLLNYPLMASSEFNPKCILDSIQIIMESGIDYEFRTTCVHPLVNESMIKKISPLIKGSKLYALQRFKNEKVLKPELFQGNTGIRGCTNKEISRMESIVKPFVQSCIVR